MRTEIGRWVKKINNIDIDNLLNAERIGKTASVHSVTVNCLSQFEKHIDPRKVMSALDSVGNLIQTVSNEVQIWPLLQRIT